jgi:hypothetical protein
VALGAMTLSVVAGLVPLSALAGLTLLAGLLGAFEVRQVRSRLGWGGPGLEGV